MNSESLTRREIVKITDEDETKPATQDRRIAARFAIALVLTGMLLVALNWALNVTNANARQVSTNLTHLQYGFEHTSSGSSQGRPGHAAAEKTHKSSSRRVSGPALEPVDSGQ